MRARTLMIQGTGSDVGKSLLVAGLCRVFRERGVKVAPFKAQNMALNAAVTPEGDEIGRAQALQALAAGVQPHVDMNPILLKPEGEMRSQVVLLGKAQPSLAACEYYARREQLAGVIEGALNRLRSRCELVIIEGAGSAAELNLRDRDLVNMHVAALCDAPVLLVADIDRGGVFASLLGTLHVLEAADRERVAGLIVNKFRGDPALFEDGVALIEQRSGLPVLGVLPYLEELRLNDEDSVAVEDRAATWEGEQLSVAVLRVPAMSNHDDFLPLEAERDVCLRYVTRVEQAADADLVILPGSKSTRQDLAWLSSRGLAQLVRARASRGQPVLGICGGYQMLGEQLVDRAGVEGPPGEVAGLGLLPVRSVFAAPKITRQVKGRVLDLGFVSEGAPAGLRIEGYEIHSGRVERRLGSAGLELELADGGTELEGTRSACGQVVGTLVHGLFENSALRTQLLRNLWARRGRVRSVESAAPTRVQELDRLAKHCCAHLDIGAIEALIG